MATFPYNLDLISPDGSVEPIGHLLTDWKLDIDFRRDIPVSLWARVTYFPTLNLLRETLHLYGGHSVCLDVTLRLVLPDSDSSFTAYEQQSFDRSQKRFLEDITTVIPVGKSLTEAARLLDSLWNWSIERSRQERVR